MPNLRDIDNFYEWALAIFFYSIIVRYIEPLSTTSTMWNDLFAITIHSVINENKKKHAGELGNK